MAALVHIICSQENVDHFTSEKWACYAGSSHMPGEAHMMRHPTDEHLSTMDACTDSLFHAWVRACAERGKLRQELCKALTLRVVTELQNIPEAEAQALEKDPQVPGLNYKICSVWQSCCVCSRWTSKTSSAHVKLLRNPVPASQV